MTSNAFSIIFIAAFMEKKIILNATGFICYYEVIRKDLTTSD